MSDYRAIFCGTYVGQCMEKVPVVRSWIHTLEVVGNKINLLRKNKLKWFFWVISFFNLRLLFLFISKAPTFMNSSSVNRIVWNKWTKYVRRGRGFFCFFLVFSIHSHNFLRPFFVLHIISPTLWQKVLEKIFKWQKKWGKMIFLVFFF